MATTKAAKKLIPPQKLKPAARKAAVEGIPAAKARAVAVKEPVSAKAKRGKTVKPLAPKRVKAILDALQKTYPNVVCALTHHNAFELTIATILSAQTTDVGVNKVTPELFRMYPTPKKLAEAPLPELERIIRTTGFYRAKAKNIQGAAHTASGSGSEDGERSSGKLVWDSVRDCRGHACWTVVAKA
jgi:endonuclease-3